LEHISTPNATPNHSSACPQCAAPLLQPSECSICGWRSHVFVGLKGSGVRVEASNIGTVAEQRTEDGEGRRVDYRPAAGGRSLSETGVAESYRAELVGALPKGTKAEPHALRVLLAALEASGRKVKEHPKKKGDDGSGKDARFEINGKDYDVQVVIMPPDQTLWKELAEAGKAARAGQLPDAVKLVRASLEKKEKWWKGCVLALDAANLGALSSLALVDAYLAEHGDPNVEFGFAQTWIVGPTVGSTFEIA
jgi:hypothetical protein